MLSLKTPRENSFLPLPASVVASLAADGITPSSAFGHHRVFPFSVGLWDQISFSYKSFCPGAHSNPVWSHLGLTTSAKTLFPNKIMFTFKALGPQPIISKRTSFSPPKCPNFGAFYSEKIPPLAFLSPSFLKDEVRVLHLKI